MDNLYDHRGFARIVSNYRLELMDTMEMPRDFYRLTALPDGSLVAAELGTSKKNFSDGELAVYQEGRRKSLLCLGEQGRGVHLDRETGKLLYCVRGEFSFHEGLPDQGSVARMVNFDDTTAISSHGGRVAVVHRAAKKICVHNRRTGSNIDLSLDSFRHHPVDVCWKDDETLIVAMKQPMPIESGPLAMVIVKLSIITGATEAVPLEATNGARNAWAVSPGPNGSFFVLGSGRLWKLDDNLDVVFSQDLYDLCPEGPRDNRVPYFAKKRSPFFFSLAWDRKCRLYVGERNFWGRIFIFNV